MNSEVQTQFQIGEHVVYPLQGVGVIKDIRERVVRDVPVLYYVIYIDMSDMTVSIPVEKVAESGVRAIVSKEDALAAIDKCCINKSQGKVNSNCRYAISGTADKFS